MFRLLYVLRSPDSGTGGSSPTVEVLLEKITVLEDRLNKIESENVELKKQNEEIKSFNRQLLDRQPGNLGSVPQADDKAKQELDKFLKGE